MKKFMLLLREKERVNVLGTHAHRAYPADDVGTRPAHRKKTISAAQIPMRCAPSRSIRADVD